MTGKTSTMVTALMDGLTTSEADPRLALGDKEIVISLLNGIKAALEAEIGNPILRLITGFDPNDYRNRRYSPEGISFTPLAVDKGKRNGPREYLLRTKEKYPNTLTIQMNVLATRVLFEGSQAIGVEFMEGPALYKASPNATPGSPAPPLRQATAREVIIAGGAFNSPQLLMLSGVGPAQPLKRLGLPVIVDLPEVGALTCKTVMKLGLYRNRKKPFSLLSGATFAPPQAGGPLDEFFQMWEKREAGYLRLQWCSDRRHQEIQSRETGTGSIYFCAARNSQRLRTWLFEGIRTFSQPLHLGHSSKAHTNNTAGRVSLRSADPRDTPLIEFHYFAEGNDSTGADLDAVVQGVDFVRKIRTARCAN